MATLDLSLFRFLHALSGRLALFDLGIVFFAKYMPYFLVLAACVFLWRAPRSWKERIYAASVMGITALAARGLIVPLIRFFYARPRPFQALNFTPLFSAATHSFPSGHAAFFFALAFVIFSFHKKWGIAFFAATFFVVLARVVSGVHWPSDILGGFAIAWLSFFAVQKICAPYGAGIRKKEVGTRE